MPKVSEHSPGWIFQTWIAFLVSTLGLGYAIYTMPSANQIKVFMCANLLFVIYAAISLAKTQRDAFEAKQREHLTASGRSVSEHSTSWVVATWIAFVSSIGGMGYGIYNMATTNQIKWFMGLGVLFVVSASLGLAKTNRDQHEAKKAEVEEFNKELQKKQDH